MVSFVKHRQSDPRLLRLHIIGLNGLHVASHWLTSRLTWLGWLLKLLLLWWGLLELLLLRGLLKLLLLLRGLLKLLLLRRLLKLLLLRGPLKLLLGRLLKLLLLRWGRGLHVLLELLLLSTHLLLHSLLLRSEMLLLGSRLSLGMLLSGLSMLLGLATHLLTLIGLKSRLSGDSHARRLGVHALTGLWHALCRLLLPVLGLISGLPGDSHPGLVLALHRVLGLPRVVRGHLVGQGTGGNITVVRVARGHDTTVEHILDLPLPLHLVGTELFVSKAIVLIIVCNNIISLATATIVQYSQIFCSY